MSGVDNSPNAARREALKKITLGEGAMSTLPILGQGVLGPRRDPAARATRGAPAAVDSDPAWSDPDWSDPYWKPAFFDEHQNQTVVALADLIIPETDTPGAKAALANRYMDRLLQQEDAAKAGAFLAGLGWMDARSLRLHGKPFVQLSQQQQTELLTPLADPDNRNAEDRPGVEFFQEMKDLTIFAYYTSRIGLEQELHYGGDDYHAEFPGACTHPEHQT